MPREWTGCVFRTEGRDTYSAKWKEFGTEKWMVTKGFATKAEANDKLAEMRRKYRQKKRGDFDEFAEHRHRPIAEHVADFREHILANRKRRGSKDSEKHGNQSRQRLLDAFEAMKVATLADLSSMKADRFLAQLLDIQKRAPKTRNDYCAALKQFAAWAEADARLERDPFGNLRFIDDKPWRQRKQTITWQQVRDLAATCVQRLLQNARGKTRERNAEIARRRGLAVVTMFLTGLRNGELAALQWSWIDFGAGYITVPHTVTKSVRTEYVPLHDGLADLLREEQKHRAVVAGSPVAGSDLVIGEMRNGKAKLPRHVNDRLRDDLEFLKLPAVDASGRELTIYSMRASFATQLTELGVLDGVVTELMRHRAPDVTREHYVQRSLRALREAVNHIPREAAHVPGLFTGEPREEPNQVRASEDGCAPGANTVAS